MKLTLDTLGLALRMERQRCSKTLAQVADVSGLSVSFLSDIENGRSRPSLRTLQKLATCYEEPFDLIIAVGRGARKE